MQKLKIKLQISIFSELWAVFTVSSFVGNPVLEIKIPFQFIQTVNRK